VPNFEFYSNDIKDAIIQKLHNSIAIEYTYVIAIVYAYSIVYAYCNCICIFNCNYICILQYNMRINLILKVHMMSFQINEKICEDHTSITKLSKKVNKFGR